MNYLERHRTLSITIAVIIIVVTAAYILGVRVHFFMEAGVPAQALTAQAIGSPGLDISGMYADWKANQNTVNPNLGDSRNSWNTGGPTISAYIPTFSIGGWRIGGPPPGTTYGITIKMGNTNAPAKGGCGVSIRCGGNDSKVETN